MPNSGAGLEKLGGLLGGREFMTGQESDDLDPNTEYFVRVTTFNGVGYGPGGPTSPSFLQPVNQLLTQPYQVSARTVDESTIETSFASPDRDGGVALTSFWVEYDASEDFGFVNGTTFEPRGGFVDVPVVREVQAVELDASSVVSEEQWIAPTSGRWCAPT